MSLTHPESYLMTEKTLRFRFLIYKTLKKTLNTTNRAQITVNYPNKAEVFGLPIL